MSTHAQPALRAHGQERDALLERVTEVLEQNPQVLAAWLLGSLAVGSADDWSDIDLYVAIADDQYEVVVQQRLDLYRRFGHVVHVQSIKRNDQNPGANFNLLVYRGGLEVDVTMFPHHLAHRPAWSLLLFDRAGIPVDEEPVRTPQERQAEMQLHLDAFRTAALIALKEIGRGYVTGAASTIQWMSESFDLLWRLLYCQDEHYPELLERRHRPAHPELEALIPRLGTTIDPQSALAVVQHLCSNTERLHPTLRECGVPVSDEMLAEVATLSALAEKIIQR